MSFGKESVSAAALLPLLAVIFYSVHSTEHLCVLLLSSIPSLFLFLERNATRGPCRAPLFRQSCVWLARSFVLDADAGSPILHAVCRLSAICLQAVSVNLRASAGKAAGRSFRCFRSKEALVASDMVVGGNGKVHLSKESAAGRCCSRVAVGCIWGSL